jgi:hypothetical protein
MECCNYVSNENAAYVTEMDGIFSASHSVASTHPKIHSSNDPNRKTKVKAES